MAWGGDKTKKWRAPTGGLGKPLKRRKLFNGPQEGILFFRGGGHLRIRFDEPQIAAPGTWAGRGKVVFKNFEG